MTKTTIIFFAIFILVALGWVALVEWADWSTVAAGIVSFVVGGAAFGLYIKYKN